MPVVERLRLLGKVRTISSIPAPDVVFVQVSRYFEGVSIIPTLDRTLAMIKPDAVSSGNTKAIIKEIEDNGFVIVSQIKKRLTEEEAGQFYGEHQGKVFYNTLINFMTSGAVVALALEKKNAVKEWRNLMGPTNSIKASLEVPTSLRARYGTDGTQNATHGSDSIYSAGRELEFWFGKQSGYGSFKTLAMIKPNTALVHYETIKSIILAHGYKIVKESHETLTEDRAREFYAEHTGKPFFPNLLDYMTSGSIVALQLEREGSIKAWRNLMGPTNTLVARKNNPESIRAIFGTDGTMNATHGSDSIDSATRELSFFFPRPPAKQIRAKKATISAASFPEMSSYMNREIDPVLTPVILKGMIERPYNFQQFIVDELSIGATEKKKMANFHR